ncbi:DUF1010 domain-containing protein [uncultured Acidovorax sp.]|uniref:DUF1010 domain-containing protein n=1 Tax=uncultured Acidovorax sp. TaxID=158751 RepID=UPI002583877D|nr:DUF1010 domain-containing protein [uncultured Acidovorax sp.]
MLIQTAFNFSSVIQRWVCRFSGLRLLALRWLLVFLASSPCAASASSYFFRSAAQPRWRCAFSQFVPVAKSKLSVLASGSNCHDPCGSPWMMEDTGGVRASAGRGRSIL